MKDRVELTVSITGRWWFAFHGDTLAFPVIPYVATRCPDFSMLARLIEKELHD